MMPGYNTDFAYRGLTFHVQTEDSGAANPVVVTLLYHKGAILASRKTSYRDLLEKNECGGQLKELMRAQHKALMRELLAGAYDDKIPPRVAKDEGAGKPAAAPAAASPVPAWSREPGSGAGQPPNLDEAITRYLEEHAAAATSR